MAKRCDTNYHNMGSKSYAECQVEWAQEGSYEEVMGLDYANATPAELSSANYVLGRSIRTKEGKRVIPDEEIRIRKETIVRILSLVINLLNVE